MEKVHKLRVNGDLHAVVVDDDTPMLYAKMPPALIQASKSLRSSIRICEQQSTKKKW